jgi:DNA polymerase-1
LSAKRLFLVDGMSHIYRAYYAIRNLSNSKGMPTGAIFGFTAMLRKLIQEQRPEYVGVAFDLEGPTVRQEKFEAYKANRKPMPEELVQQLPYIRRVCEAFHVPVIGFSGYEADDVIGTLSKKAVDKGLECIIVTGDKDMLQLVSGEIKVLDPAKDNLILDTEKVIEKLGVRPEQVPDLLGLWGDSSDNIPGAPGIGEKGAKELVQTFGTLEKCLENWNQVKRKTYQESLRDNVDLIRMSKELATIHRDLPIDLNLEALGLSEPDRAAAFALFAELEFKTLMQEFLDEDPGDTLRGKYLRDADAVDFLQNLRREGKIYFILKHREGQLGRKRAMAACVCSESGQAGVVDLKSTEVAKAWNRLLSDPHPIKTCWDAKLCMLSQGFQFIPLSPPIEDAMLMAFLVAPHLGDYSLRRWALDHLHMTLPEDKQTGADLLDDLPDESCVEPLCRHVDALRRLSVLLRRRLSELDLNRVFEDIETPLIPVLADMERTGVKIDRRTLQVMSAEMEQQIGNLTAKIYQAAGMEFNINSTKQLGEVLFERLNLPTSKKTKKTRGYSTDQSVLEELAESYEIPRLIIEYRQVSKLKSTYVDSLPQLIRSDTGRVHTSYNQTGAATGRLSSSDPNLQNIPVRTDLGRLIRGAFVPEAGNWLISADYSQVELRVLAHLSEDPVLMDAFRRNEDIHERTAREVFEPAQLENRAECRRMAKTINFGIIYGLSAFGLAQRLGIGREAAQRFIDAYFERYKGVRAWLDQTLEEARRNSQVRTLFGRIRPIPEILSKDFNVRQFAERTALNSPIQGTAADLIKIAMIGIHNGLKTNQLASKLLLQVHDELVLEVPEAELQATQQLVRLEMENAAPLKVPLIVDMNVAQNWKEMK